MSMGAVRLVECLREREGLIRIPPARGRSAIKKQLLLDIWVIWQLAHFIQLILLSS